MPFTVNTQAVRDAFGRRHRDERPPACDAAGLMVEVEDVDRMSPAVDVIHKPLVRAPVDPVGHRYGGEHRFDVAIGVEAVEPALPGAPIVGQSACPESAGGVCLAIVHRVVRPVRFDRHEPPQILEIRLAQPEPSSMASTRPPRSRRATDPTGMGTVNVVSAPVSGSYSWISRPGMSSQNSMPRAASQTRPSPTPACASTTTSGSSA